MPIFGIDVKPRSILFLYIAVLILQQPVTLFGILHIFENNITLLGKESIAAMLFGLIVAAAVFCVHIEWDRIAQKEYDNYVPRTRGSHPLFWAALFAVSLQIYIFVFGAGVFGKSLPIVVPVIAVTAFIILVAVLLSLLTAYQTHYSHRIFLSKAD